MTLTPTITGGGLLTADSIEVSRRFSESAATADNRMLPTAQFHDWLAERGRRNDYEVTQVPFDRLRGWRFADGTRNLVHESGRFYSIQGLDVRTDHREAGHWTQPIIVQPEIGILGILVKQFDGVLHCLMQAKMEPGNVNTLQLSPTIQATHSNYTRVHKGAAIPYLDHFVAPRRGRVLVDVLQSEQGAWFLSKRNRNMVVETDEDIPLRQDFCWLTIAQLHELLRVDNLVNMDARTVVSGIPFAAPVDRPSVLGEDSFRGALTRSLAEEHGALHDTASVLSWFTELKARHRLEQRLIPLDRLDRWRRTPSEIQHVAGRYFTVIGVDVHATNREVSHWSQPLLSPSSGGVLAFLTKRIDGVLHLLIQARTEAGTHDIVEMAPTVHCAPGNFTGTRRPRYLDEVLAAPESRIRYDVVHSEEGGRFYHAQNRYLVVETEDDFPLEVPDDFVWMTARQVTDLIRYGNHFNVEARSLLAGLHTLW